MTRPTLTIALPNYGDLFGPGEWHRFVDLAPAAEAAGIDRVIVVDHVVLGPHPERYPWGTFPTGPTGNWLEPMTLLAAMAAVTREVRLMTSVLIAPLRPAALLAKQAATLDIVARGRLDLGVGVGWQPEEYDALGLDYEQRGQLLTDTLGACRALWRDTPAHFTSPTITFRDIYCEPKPIQPDGVPFWVAGSLHRRNVRRVISAGSGWLPIIGESIDGLAAGVAQLRAALTDAGRDPATLQVQGRLPLVRTEDGRVEIERSLDTLPALVAAGATDVYVPMLALTPDPAAAPAAFADFAGRFRRAQS